MYRIPRLISDGPGDSLPVAGEPPPEALHPAVAMTVGEEQQTFFSLSAELTGFDEVELRGTGVGHVYLRWLSRVFSAELEQLLEAWRTIEHDAPPGERAAALREQVLDNATLGPFTRAVLALWYTATWTPPAGSAPSPEKSRVRRRLSRRPDVACGGRCPPGRSAADRFGTWGFAPGGA